LTILKSFSLIFVSLVFIGHSFAVIDQGSVAGLWLLDEGGGGTVGDSSGNGNDGSIIGEPGWTNGKFGKALEFDGEDDMVDTPYVSDDQSGAFTIMAWIKPSIAISTQIVVAGRSNGGPQLNIASEGVAMTGFKMDNGQFAHVRGKTVFPEEEWTNIAGTYDGSDIRVYVNGVEEGSLKPTNAPGLNAYTFQIGAFDESLHGGGYIGQFAPAGIDEVAVFNVALSEDEIKTIVAQGLYMAVFAVSPSGKLAATWGSIRL
jgi:hypothetical protein